MITIATFEDFLKTYSKKTQERVRLYLKVMKLREKYGYGGKKIAKLLNISRHKIEGWLYQKNVPRPIKALKMLERLGINLPLQVSKNNRFILFLKIFAFTFGDGGIGKSFRVYLTGDRKDLEILKKEINDILGLKCKIDEINSDNTKIGDRLISGESFELDVQGKGSRILGRLLHSAGAPMGDKVTTPFLLPYWIMKGQKWVKKIFLEVLMANELQTPKLGNYGCHFVHVRFMMVKTKEHLKTHRIFLNQIRKLLEEFEIEVSEVKLGKPRKDRKDQKLSYPMYFEIYRNKINLYRFYTQFKLLYAREKQKIFDEAARAIRRSLENEFRKIDQFNRAKEMKKMGLGCRRIAKALGIPQKRSMIDGWLRYSQKPIYMDKKEELERLLKYFI